MTKQYTKRLQTIPNGRTICRPNGHKIYQQRQLQDLPKFTQIGIFGLKNTIWQHWCW
jgi:hypothetical protein